MAAESPREINRSGVNLSQASQVMRDLLENKILVVSWLLHGKSSFPHF